MEREFIGRTEISDMRGKTCSHIEVDKHGAEMVFHTVCGHQYIMVHEQDCCENVSLDDICGDLEDLLHTPIVVAEAITNTEEDWEGDPQTINEIQLTDLLHGNEEYTYDTDLCDSYTWTFYKMDTVKGGVTLRWFGESNGYYSEDVSIKKYKLT